MKREKINSINFSCRMRADLYASLLNESKKKGISFNSLLNSICKKHNSWEKFDDIGFVPLSYAALDQIFDILDEKSITSIARYTGEIIPKKMAISSHIGNDFEKLAALVDIILNRFGTVFVLKKNHGYTFTIRHKVNKNFSLYISEFFLAMGRIFNIYTNVDLIAKNAVIVNLENKPSNLEIMPKRLKSKHA